MTETFVLVSDVPDAGALRRPGALARLAFGSAPSAAASHTLGPRHLAFLPPESLELDLDDPAHCQFGDYHLLEKLGQGGMGVVYRARQISLDRDVAVKLLSAGPWASSNFIERFRREAQSAARMQHPNIVAIFEIGSQDELNFFSMRLVRGQSLAQLLAEGGPLAPRKAAALLRTIAEALDYAHRLGVLHLDLKPGNILIDERGEPQVADFGLARRMDETLAADNDEVSGTPSYMAPEQAQVNSYKLSPATDIYGLGAILYELLTGSPPFLGPTPQETLERSVTLPAPAPRHANPAVPRDLDAVCLKCLEKDPNRRYASARALAADLACFMDGRPVSVRPLNRFEALARWARREPKLAALGVLLLASLGAGLGATLVQWQRAEANAAASNERVWEGRRETALRLQQSGKGFEAASRLLLNVVERERTGGDGAARVERSQLGVLFGQAVTLVDSMLLADANPLAAEISPEGRLLAVALNDSTVRWFDTRTLEERGRVDLTGLPTSEGFPKVPALLRFVDDRRLRVTLEWYDDYISPQDGDSFLVDLDSGTLIEPPREFADLAHAIYSPDGDYALLRNRSGQLQLWQVRPWKALAPPFDTGDPGPQSWTLGRGARYAARSFTVSHVLELYDPHDLSRPLPVAIPDNAGFSAWAESSDGAWLALGDTEGRIMLMDVATRETRVLPTPKGRDISWLAFSEDDAWLAASNLDGSAYAFDVASGTPLTSGVMQHGFELRRVGISRAQRLLVAAGNGQIGLWRLPDPKPQSMAPSRLGTAPARDALSGQYAAGWSLRTGLLATAGVEGMVRLWRLPRSPVVSAGTPRLLSGALHFDGKRIVDVASNQLRIVAPDGTPMTRWLRLPGVPGYAELVEGGDTLLVTVANALDVYDSTTLRPRVPSIVLPATPQNLVAGADGRFAALSFGISGGAGFQERIAVYDLESGSRESSWVTVDGPLRQLELSPDGALLLATGPRKGATHVFRIPTLERVGEYAHDPQAPVIWAAFATTPGALLLALRADDPRQQDDALLRWEWATGEVRSRSLLPNLRAVGVAATPLGAFVAGSNYDHFDPGGTRSTQPERLAGRQPTAAFAASPDGRLLAHAFRNEVQLYDARTLAHVGPPLYADVSQIDWLVRLAFAPDSRSLLARISGNSWLVWQVGADERGAAELQQALPPLRDEGSFATPRRVPTLAERQGMRRADAGPWPSPESRPLAKAARVVNGGVIPVRPTHIDPLLLDLTQVYNLPPDLHVSEQTNVLATQRYLGTGLQRLAGVDYDIRGSMQMAGNDSGLDAAQIRAAGRFAERGAGIAVPAVPIAAFHVLLFAGHRSTEAEERLYAQVRLHYRDGSSAVLPIRTTREVPGWTENDGPVPFAWAHGEHLRISGAPEQVMLSNPRLPNPHPERIVSTLDLERGDGTWNHAVFLAVTAEPVTAAAGPRTRKATSTTNPPP